MTVAYNHEKWKSPKMTQPTHTIPENYSPYPTIPENDSPFPTIPENDSTYPHNPRKRLTLPHTCTCVIIGPMYTLNYSVAFLEGLSICYKKLWELALSCNPSYLGGKNWGMAWSGRTHTTRRIGFCCRTMAPLLGEGLPRRSDSNEEKRSCGKLYITVETGVRAPARDPQYCQTQFSIL